MQIQRRWIPDQVRDDRRREVRAGFRPRTPRGRMLSEFRDRGAAASAGALRWRHVMARG